MYKKYYYNFYAFNEIYEKDKDFEDEQIKDYLKLRKEEGNDLKFVINFSWDNLLDKNTYPKIDEMLEAFAKNGIEKEDIIIGVNKENHRFNSKEWKLILAVDKKFEEMGIVFGFEDMDKTFTVKEVENANIKINQTVDKIRKEKLSPYECLLAGYLTVIEREYIEETANEHASKSRSIYGVLNNKEIVCTGYAEYLKAILERADTKNIRVYNNSVATSSDNKYIDEYHSNLIIYIKDEKYGIDGYYYLDPTWDSYDENQVPNLEYFMVPINDIQNIKIDHIRSENVLPEHKSMAGVEQDEDVDVIYDDKDLEDVSFTSDALEFSTKFIDDYLDANPQILSKLKSVVKKRNFECDYAQMEKLEKVVNAEQQALEMFEGIDMEVISDKQYTILVNAITELEAFGDDEKFIHVVEGLITNHYLEMYGIKKPKLSYKKPQEFLEKNIPIIRERLTRVQNLKTEEVSDDDIYEGIMSDKELLEVIADEIKQKSMPIHAGKTMDALRVVYGKMYPEILPKLIDRRVKETISHNTKMSKRHFNKKSQSPFLELYNLEKVDKQK